MNNIEPMSICLAIGGQVVSDLMCIVSILFYDVGRHAVFQHVPCQNIKNLQYDIILGIDWLKSTNAVIDWVACSLDLTIDSKLHTVLAFLVNSVANLALSSLNKCWLK